MAIKQGNNKKEFEIPEGKEVKDVRVVCKKHGDITGSVVMIAYTTEDPETKEKSEIRCGYCLPCLNEYLLSLEKEGKISGVYFVPILGDKEENSENETDEKASSEEESDEVTDEEITTKD